MDVSRQGAWEPVASCLLPSHSTVPSTYARSACPGFVPSRSSVLPQCVVEQFLFTRGRMDVWVVSASGRGGGTAVSLGTSICLDPFQLPWAQA